MPNGRIWRINRASQSPPSVVFDAHSIHGARLASVSTNGFLAQELKIVVQGDDVIMAGVLLGRGHPPQERLRLVTRPKRPFHTPDPRFHDLKDEGDVVRRGEEVQVGLQSSLAKQRFTKAPKLPGLQSSMIRSFCERALTLKELSPQGSLPRLPRS